ncbi:Notch ligand involved in the mediation of Notch signaling (By similarity) [Seminavis robusta]|uniref:Notch ligand involved in the mediation of Notch signaling By similarity n=1 Tax=Seminavis robusta TaxID=568900 RepID=A0A9N8HSK8_9STRA|nr:Notch ligand involved in the mediation of Notch signaling (By similarity) [Seminavis robusta]|eukprot:Sro1457_g274320.1 Notch ligand involved in the mediation of Notch signaling (By similarity) (350) ;mRNA; f:7543-8592
MAGKDEKSKTTTVTMAASGNSRPEGYTNICADGHACDNDATCVESLLEEHKYVCDCHEAYLQTGRVYAGLSCQHVATQYCTSTGEISETLFCVNDGVCRNKVGVSAQHPGCECPPEYSGDHCQYIAGGSEPDALSYFLDGTTFASAMDGSTSMNSNNNGVLVTTEGPGINPAAIVLPILTVTLCVVGYLLWKYRTHNLRGHMVDKNKAVDENMMDADGSSMLKNPMTQMMLAGRRNSTPAFSSTHKAALMDPPDFEDLLEQSDHVKFHVHPATAKLYASDPMLHYNGTSDTSGSGSPTSYSEEYDIGQSQRFEEYDPNDFGTHNIEPALGPRPEEEEYEEPTDETTTLT